MKTIRFALMMTAVVAAGCGGAPRLASAPAPAPSAPSPPTAEVVDPLGPVCGCGSRGCLETLASATAARRRALEDWLLERTITLARVDRRSVRQRAQPADQGGRVRERRHARRGSR